MTLLIREAAPEPPVAVAFVSSRPPRQISASVGAAHSFRQELDGGLTLRFGPLSAIEVASALSDFVY